ncbi:MAG: C1 family peptidase [Candidatus Pacebacteria bacterium]|nr:C1 family peptidase [Candidatus Paceibacterota bacterium]
MKHKKIRTFFCIISLLLISKTAFALENIYPEIAGKNIGEGSTFLDYVVYGFALVTALGAVIMFVILMRAGLKMITGSANSREAKKEVKRASFGLFLLLAVYLILNTINPYLVKIQTIDQPCKEGVSLQIEKTKTVDNKTETNLYDLCIKSSIPDLETIKKPYESDFSACITKAVISYPEINYQGSPSVIFDDTSSKTKDCTYNPSVSGAKSLRIIPKMKGAYLYDKGGYGIGENSPAPLFFHTGIDDLAKDEFDNKTKSINIISKDYSDNPISVSEDSDDTITTDYVGAIIFENPGYKGKCLPIDSNNESLTGTDKAIGSVDLSEKISSIVVFSKKIHSEKITDEEKNYIYLYAVRDCGKNINKDNLEIGFLDKNKNPTIIKKNKDIITSKINDFLNIITTLPYFINKGIAIIGEQALGIMNYEKNNFNKIVIAIKDINNSFDNSIIVKNPFCLPIDKAFAESSSFRKSYNWTKAHGKNWLTGFKDQGSTGTCWAHSAIGTLEAQIRLYYNQPELDLNLSEQMMIDCTNGEESAYSGNELYLSPNPYNSHPDCFFVEVNEDTFANRGIADEACDSWSGRDTKMYTGADVCETSVCSDWEERVWKNSSYLGYGDSSDTSCPNKTHGITEIELKKMLITKGPLDVAGEYLFTSGVGGHTMVLVGYETDSSGTTTWIFKNSWGSSGSGSAGDGLTMDGGFLRVTTSDNTTIYNASIPVGSFTPPSNKAYWPTGFDGEIKCTDADNDGYCFWGSSDEKPSSCNALTCEEEKDCDDSDATGHIFDSNYNCGDNASGSCIDNDNDGYCYWEGEIKPAACDDLTCEAEKDCNDDDDTAHEKCVILPDSSISPAEPIPDPEPDPVYGVGGLYDVCKIEIPELEAESEIMNFEELISEQCAGKFAKTKSGKTYDIVSFKIGGPAGVVIKGSNGNCLYWDTASVEKTGSCVNDLRGSDVFNTNIVSEILGTTVKPKSIIVFPKD